MESITVSFFGHRYINDMSFAEQCLKKCIEEMLENFDYVQFLVGRDGDFDRIVSSMIRSCKKNIRDDNSCFVLVLPYMTAEFRDNEIHRENWKAVYKFSA